MHTVEHVLYLEIRPVPTAAVVVPGQDTAQCDIGPVCMNK